MELKLDSNQLFALSQMNKLQEELTFAVLANPNHNPDENRTTEIVENVMKGILLSYGFEFETKDKSGEKLRVAF